MLPQKIAKTVLPASVRDQIRTQRVEPILKYIYRGELSHFIESSPLLSEESVQDTMRKHGYKNRWAAVYTLLSGVASADYVPEDTFQIHILPRMLNMKLIKAYEDKNFYDTTALKKYTVPAVIRKIDGRYYDGGYNPISQNRLQTILKKLSGDLVIKPAIDSGSGRNVWIGPSENAYARLIEQGHCSDIVVQKKIRGNVFFQKIHPQSLNTVRTMSAFTGTGHIILASALRMGRGGTKVDNQNAGGLVLAIHPDGLLNRYAYDKNLNRYKRHPDSDFAFAGQYVPGLDDIHKACLEMHKYLPHFGLISWDVTMDEEGTVRIIEFNLDWQGINLFQSALGPLFGTYKDQIKKTYNLPDWES